MFYNINIFYISVFGAKLQIYIFPFSVQNYKFILICANFFVPLCRFLVKRPKRWQNC